MLAPEIKRPSGGGNALFVFALPEGSAWTGRD
jgi:hypothetical protein